MYCNEVWFLLKVWLEMEKCDIALHEEQHQQTNAKNFDQGMDGEKREIFSFNHIFSLLDEAIPMANELVNELC